MPIEGTEWQSKDQYAQFDEHAARLKAAQEFLLRHLQPLNGMKCKNGTLVVQQVTDSIKVTIVGPPNTLPMIVAYIGWYHWSCGGRVLRVLVSHYANNGYATTGYYECSKLGKDKMRRELGVHILQFLE